jgi:hypothetical protein
MYDDLQLVSAGYPTSIMGADPSTQDLATLLAATSGDLAIMGQGAGDELDFLDQAGVSGAEAALTAQKIAQIKAAKLAQASLLTRPDRPTKAREFPLGFESAGVVAAGLQATVISRPQIVFRPERLIVPSDIAGQFTVNDIIIGKNSQKVSTVAVPARTFDERGVGVRMQLDTAQISQDIALVVTNISGADATFRASMIGSAVE